MEDFFLMLYLVSNAFVLKMIVSYYIILMVLHMVKSTLSMIFDYFFCPHLTNVVNLKFIMLKDTILE